MALLSSVAVSTTAIIIAVVVLLTAQTGVANWCVARSDASDQALQTALDYACWAGADCAPILTNGLCFLPNTLIAHASYAFDSYFQRKNMAPGSCDFSGTATVAKTDPSYGSCVYPSSPSTAGGTVPPAGPGTTTPTTIYVPPPPFGGTPPMFGGGGLTPGMGPVFDEALKHTNIGINVGTLG
ncbi:hypothetical protein LguiB_026262 [Lonicera macranthoides]